MLPKCYYASPATSSIKRLANILQDSSYRMKALIENILDFARGRFGEGIILNRSEDNSVEEALQQVITELAITWPGRTINANFELNGSVNCDVKRVAQVLSNLLGNALTHGKKDSPVTVNVLAASNEFIMRVVNEGKPIPDAVKEKLFQPFSRGEVVPNQQGLGLGLYIASEIAHSHGGTLDVESNEQETVFTFKIPVV
jgi:signal transduction histidine kinase